MRPITMQPGPTYPAFKKTPMMAHPEEDISPKQLSFLKSLIGETDFTATEARVLVDKTKAQRLLAIRDESSPNLSKGEASELIELLRQLPKRDAEVGYYLVPSHGPDPDVYTIVWNKERTRKYAKVLLLEGSRAKWVYAPNGKGAVLQHGEKLTVEQAAKLGRLHGVCVVCGRVLSDPESVEAGIGPVCKTRLL